MSDSHGRDENVMKAVRREEPFDALIHLGDSQEEYEEFRYCVDEDCPVYMVAGNCDASRSLPETQIVELAGHRLLLTHGHYYYVSFGTKDLAADARTNGCDLALYGHTHRPDLDPQGEDLTILNPGSISYPRQEGRRPSYLILTLLRGKAPEYELKFL